MTTTTFPTCGAPSPSENTASIASLVAQLAPIPHIELPRSVPHCDSETVRCNAKLLRQIVVNAAGEECSYLDAFDGQSEQLNNLTYGMDESCAEWLPVAVLSAYSDLKLLANCIVDRFVLQELKFAAGPTAVA